MTDLKNTASMYSNELFMKITDEEFENIRKLVYEQFGINLTEQKRGLVVGRLQKLLRSKGFTSFSDYYSYLKSDPKSQRIDELINRISTNYTYFFREKAHFDFMIQTVLPELSDKFKKNNNRDIRIWSAGCSSGEEPYSLVMMLLEYFGNEYGLWDAGVLATDVSNEVLKTAVTGIYTDEQVNLLPKVMANKYFTKHTPGFWKVAERVKKEVTFRTFNLMTSRFPFKKPFHAIFCRNVMIYFDAPTRMGLVKRFFDFTAQGGYLFIGHSESLGRHDSPYRYIMPAVYKKD
jgi:chemotaxis protein methyltransferase CheR